MLNLLKKEKWMLKMLVIPLILLIYSCEKVFQEPSREELNLKPEEFNLGYGVYVSIPDNVEKFMREKKLDKYFKSRNYSKIVRELEKLIPQIKDSSILTYVYLMCGILPYEGHKSDFDNPEECKKRIYYLEKVVTMTEDRKILALAYGNLDWAYGTLKNYNKAIFYAKKMVEECQGIGEGENVNAVAITGVADAYNFMNLAGVSSKEKMDYLIEVSERYKGTDVALSALSLVGQEAIRQRDVVTLKKIVTEMESYPFKYLKKYSQLISSFKDYIRMREEKGK
jgi:tetratricopeptide (TPR) repeat protein